MDAHAVRALFMTESKTKKDRMKFSKNRIVHQFLAKKDSNHQCIHFQIFRPHLLLSGRTVHPEIPEGDTEDEIAMAAKMKEAAGFQ